MYICSRDDEDNLFASIPHVALLLSLTPRNHQHKQPSMYEDKNPRHVWHNNPQIMINWFSNKYILSNKLKGLENLLFTHNQYIMNFHSIFLSFFIISFFSFFFLFFCFLVSFLFFLLLLHVFFFFPSFFFSKIIFVNFTFLILS